MQSGSYYDVTRHFLVIDGKPTKDFGVYLSGDGTFKAAEKNLEEFTIPGRNGTFHYKSDTYKNVMVPYDCFIFKDFKRNVAALRSFLLSREGYVRIEDTHHPGEFRMGIYHEEFDPEVFVDLTAAEFTLNFDCKPERWLMSGERLLLFDAPASELGYSEFDIRNPTYFTSKPFYRVYKGIETGNPPSFNIVNDDYLKPDGTYDDCYVYFDFGECPYIDLDTETMDAYYGTTSMNNAVVLAANRYPVLKPGMNKLFKSDEILKIEIIPRWWTL